MANILLKLRETGAACIQDQTMNAYGMLESELGSNGLHLSHSPFGQCRRIFIVMLVLTYLS